MLPRVLPLLTALVLMAGCDASWSYVDADGDGVMPDGGDCDEGDASIYPGAPDTWYDGIDSDCAGDNDFDADLDGYDGGPDGEDCDDDNASVHPDALDTWYDGVDSDCAGNSDFDFDGDGFDSAADLESGDDCDDTDADIYPDAPGDTWYDGVDTDCDDTCDYDQDGDGYIPLDYQDVADTSTGGNCDVTEGGAAFEFGDCDDLDPSAFYDPTVEEDWYNGVDENCDDNDGDQDGDGYWHLDYETLVSDAGGTPLEIPADKDGDCWDDADQASDYAAQYGWDDLSASDVHPDATDRWYDGIDQDCAGDSVEDDLDQDGDGETPEYYGGTDCNDGGAVDPTGGIVDDTNDAGLSASAIRAGAVETWYDGTDQDCDDADDYDADGDGHQHESFGGTDCYEATAYDSDSDPGGVGAANINPDQTETWYDGTDQDCDDASDDDADGDGYDHEAQGGTDCFEDTSKDSDTNPGGIDADDINPGEAETWYDGTDQDCGNESSDYDADEDGYDHEEAGGTDCYEGTSLDEDSNPGGLAAASIYPGATDVWYDGTDADCDDASDYDADADGQDSDSYGGEDCDDTNDEVYEGRTEDCSTVDDDDCDGSTNERNADNCSTFYYDADGDTFGISTNRCYCEESGSYSATVSGDCDDTDSAINPDASEICDGIDNDCDDATDDDDGSLDTSTADTYYDDGDGDGYGDPSDTAPYCSSSVATSDGYVSNSNDCDDTSALAYTGATEVCDDYDNDCDGDVDDDDAGVDASDGGSLYYYDGDSDGYGTSSTTAYYCESSSATADSYVSNSGDCDDGEELAWTGADEVCDGVDNDCDGDTDDDDDLASGAGTLYYDDNDGDGYGSDSTTDYFCSDPGGDWVTTGGDCCDSGDRAGTTFPGSAENESGTACMTDQDGDGYGSDDPPICADADGVDCLDSTSDSHTYSATDDDSEALTDNDCDGYYDEDAAAAGDIYITEFLQDPPGSANQWFEIYNGSDREIDLTGWSFSISDVLIGDAEFCIPDGMLSIESGSYAVLCAGDTYDGSTACEYDWTADTGGSGFSGCAAGDDSATLPTDTANDVIVTVSVDGSDIDAIDYGTLSTSGISVTSSTSAMLSSTIVGAADADTDNDDGGNWCESSTTYTTTPDGYGTPGSANDCTP